MARCHEALGNCNDVANTGICVNIVFDEFGFVVVFQHHSSDVEE